MRPTIIVASIVASSLAVVVPLTARQAAPPVPTVKEPLRFSAFAVSMQSGISGEVEVAIERWTSDTERQTLVDLLSTASFKTGGQDKLLRALQDTKVRNGYIRTANSIGWDLKYAGQNTLPDGTRQIVIATDKPVSFLAAATDAQSMDYPFSVVEMRMKPNDKGEGRLLMATAVSVKNGRLELENYGQEPVRLTTITERDPKKK